MSFTVPLDADGFLRRKCPNCKQEFKWYSGRAAGTPDDWADPPVYWCPLCGETAQHGAWWTPAQLEYGMASAAPEIQDQAVEELRRGLGGNRGFLRFEVTPGDRPPTPDPLAEPDDMVIVEPPCHPWEPLKVPEDGRTRFHCLACGQEFSA